MSSPNANANASASANGYLRTKVLTATPEQLQLMLYDGAIRFAEQGKAALARGDFDASYALLVKSQKIVIELTCGLRRDMDADLCQKLVGLYNFAYMKLVEANVHREASAVDEALDVLKYQRETWVMLLDKLSKQKATVAARAMAIPAPDGRMEGALRLSA